MTDKQQTTGLRVLVCGGRDYQNSDIAYQALDWIKLHWGIATIIYGGASGADELGVGWAEHRCVSAELYRADWNAHGKAAGPIRNQRMIDEGRPNFVVAFPGGRGTADMINRARKARIRVMEIPA